MVTFELIEDVNEIVKYNYFPEDRKDYMPGIFTLNKNKTCRISYDG